MGQEKHGENFYVTMSGYLNNHFNVQVDNLQVMGGEEWSGHSDCRP